MIKNMKQTIEALTNDNTALREDIQDYKKAMEFLVSKHKELQVFFFYEKMRIIFLNRNNLNLKEVKVGQFNFWNNNLLMKEYV